MHLASFVNPSGQASYGIVIGDIVRDVGAVLGDQYADLRAVLEADALDELRAVTGTPELDTRALRWLPPIPNPGKIPCIGVNYHAHRDEMGRADNASNPTVFVRWPTSFVGHGEPIVKPRESDSFDYEGELAVVIGKAGRRIPRDQALDHVAGYSCLLDASVRDWQRHTTQFTPGKNFESSGAWGPWIVTSDELTDPTSLHLQTRVAGEVMQDSTTDLLIDDIPALIAYLSTVTTLAPGDVIATGTPGGVGTARTPPRYLQPAELVEVEISGIGTLTNRVVEG